MYSRLIINKTSEKADDLLRRKPHSAQKNRFSFQNMLFCEAAYGFIKKKMYLCNLTHNDMETKEQNKSAIEAAESIVSRYWVNHVESGLPHWLVEAAFVCYLVQAVTTWTPLMHWMEAHAPLALAVIQTFGALVMYFGLLRGMRRLYRPLTLAWWVVIVLHSAGFFTQTVPSIMYTIGLPVAVSLMLVYLPLGSALAYSYRGRLRRVGIWMAVYILVSNIVPVLWYLCGAPDSGIFNIVMEFSTIGVIVVYAWMLRRVLI